MEKAFPFDIISHTVPVFSLREYPHALLDDSQDLYISVKQYVPRTRPITSTSPSDPITILATGGLGFDKELYEPFFAEILERAHTAGTAIRAIWIADFFNTGQGAILNGSHLGSDPAWVDHVRDLWNVVNHFRKDMVKPIVGLGHSMGCNQLVYLSHWHPRLFDSLVFVEPGMDCHFGKGIVVPWSYQWLKRKDSWQTREDAERDLIKLHAAKSWDPRVVRRLTRYGIYERDDTSKKEWSATTPKEQIVTLIARCNPEKFGVGPGGLENLTLEQRGKVPDVDPEAWTSSGGFYRTELKGAWDLLAHVRPWVLYVNGDNSPFFGRPTTRDERAKITGTGVGGNGGLRLGAVEQEIIKDGTHTLVFEQQMCEVADVVSKWLGKEVKRWQDGSKRRMQEWQSKTVAQRQMVPKEHEAALKQELLASRKPKL